MKKFRGFMILLDKAYINRKFSEEMNKNGVKYIAIKRDNDKRKS